MQHTETPMTGIRCGPCGQEERLIARGALHPPQRRLATVTKSTAPADPEPLRCAFGFTDAEAELAIALAGGQCFVGVPPPAPPARLRSTARHAGAQPGPARIAEPD